jgi:hypothetical protein
MSVSSYICTQEWKSGMSLKRPKEGKKLPVERYGEELGEGF